MGHKGVQNGRQGGFVMIVVSRLNGKEFYLNPDLIEFIEETPDTVVTLTTGKKVVVEETAQTMIERIVEYKMKVFSALPKVVARDQGQQEQ